MIPTISKKPDELPACVLPTPPRRPSKVPPGWWLPCGEIVLGEPKLCVLGSDKDVTK